MKKRKYITPAILEVLVDAELLMAASSVASPDFDDDNQIGGEQMEAKFFESPSVFGDE